MANFGDFIFAKFAQNANANRGNRSTWANLWESNFENRVDQCKLILFYANICKSCIYFKYYSENRICLTWCSSVSHFMQCL